MYALEQVKYYFWHLMAARNKKTEDGFVKRLREVVIKVATNNVSRFANTLRLNQSLVNKYVTGKTEPGLVFFQKLIQEFPETDLHWLLTGESKKTMKKQIERTFENYASRLSQLPPKQLENVLALLEAVIETQLKTAKRKK